VSAALPGTAHSIREADAALLADSTRFRSEIVEPCLPVVLRGAFSDWPAVHCAAESPAALRGYLARFATEASAEAFVGAPGIGGRYTYSEGLDGYNFDRIKVDLLGGLDRILAQCRRREGPTLYLGSLETEIHLPGFAAENRVTAIPSAIQPRIWIGNASSVSCHNDLFENIAGVVAGRRRFTLFPPEAIADLYVGPIDFTMAGRPISLAVGSERGDSRYPRFEKWRDRALVVELAPGDALYLPKLWWHQVEATEAFNVLVNYWFDAFRNGPDAPDTAMMLAMIAIAERPIPERAAWRAYFDHYVFRGGGHPLAHLPAERHGILGPLRDNYGRIRALVMQMLRGA
jgi:hypothetical protein